MFVSDTFIVKLYVDFNSKSGLFFSVIFPVDELIIKLEASSPRIEYVKTDEFVFLTSILPTATLFSIIENPFVTISFTIFKSGFSTIFILIFLLIFDIPFEAVKETIYVFD